MCSVTAAPIASPKRYCHPERSRETCFYGMSMEKTYHVYILASRSRVLYTGVTNDLIGRVAKPRAGSGSTFTAKYRIHRLIHEESFRNVRDAIAREKQIKSWTREKKLQLLQRGNPTWIDLAADWFSPYPRKAGPSASLGMTNVAVRLKTNSVNSNAQA